MKMIEIEQTRKQQKAGNEMKMSQWDEKINTLSIIMNWILKQIKY